MVDGTHLLLVARAAARQQTGGAGAEGEDHTDQARDGSTVRLILVDARDALLVHLRGSYKVLAG